MNNNLLPSIIIAASILASGILIKYEIDNKASFSSRDLLNSLDNIANEKDKDGNTRVKKSIAGLIGEVASGVKDGFEKGFSSADNGAIAGLSDIEISQIKFVDGRMSNEEKIIGIIKNKGNKTISDIELNVVVKDKDGKLIDVVSSFAKINGILLADSELGFGVDRSIGSFGEDKEKRKKKKGVTAELKVKKMKISKEKAPHPLA